MTMPGFEQAKEDWLSHDDWQYADRDACWKFFYSAGQSDRKAIPMKYRRMEFNAQLQAELAAAREEIAKLQANLRMARWERAESELIEQLAVSQADNEQLREALSLVRKYRVADSDAWVGKVDKALSTKPDNSVLREHDAKLVERIAGEAPTPAIFEWISKFADKIRKGEF